MKLAFATLLTKDSYLPGALVLYQSLQTVSSKYELVIMITAGLSKQARRLLDEKNIKIQEIESLQPSNDHKLDSYDSRFMDTWTKLRAFELVEYDRIVLLDSDMVVLRNMDDLLEYELPGPDWIAACHACTCNPHKLPHYPSDWTPETCAFTGLVTIGDHVPPAKEISDDTPRTYGLLNSGTVLLQPSLELSRSLYHYLSTSPLVPTFTFPDQDLLAHFFKGRWRPLPYVYNSLKTLRVVHPQLWRDDHVCCVHYILNDKPWTVPPGSGGPYEVLNGWWWKMYDEVAEKARNSDVEGHSLLERHVKRS